jgi:hypothetical protein
VAYSKLYSSIVHSSLWTESDHIRLLFITLLAIADREGYVYGSRNGLLRLANLDVDECDEDDPFEALMSPDKDSSDLMRNPENEGRRIERVPSGFRILNYEYYRGLRNEDDRREQNREAQRRHRSKVSQDKPPSAKISQGQTSPSASASACKCTEEEAVQYCTTAGLTKEDGQWFWNKCEGCGWKNNGKAIKDWKKTVTAWRMIKIFPSQKQSRNGPAALPATWADRKALKQTIDELQEKKNELFKLKQREARQFTPPEQAKYDALAKRLEQLKSA